MYYVEFKIKDTTESITSVASNLNLQISIGRGVKLPTSIYYKREDFNFHITNSIPLNFNIQPFAAYELFTSQFIRSTRAYSSYKCFILKVRRLCSKLHLGTLKIVIQKMLWSIRGSYKTLWCFPFVNIKWYSEPRLEAVTSQPIRLFSMVWPWYRAWSLLNCGCFLWRICIGCCMPARNAYPSGHLVSSLFDLHMLIIKIVEISLPKLAVIFRLQTLEPFSILLRS